MFIIKLVIFIIINYLFPSNNFTAKLIFLLQKNDSQTLLNALRSNHFKRMIRFRVPRS